MSSATIIVQQPKNCKCYQWFLKFLREIPVETTESEIQLFLKEELNIALESFEPKLQTILPYLFIIYLKSWPNWKLAKQFGQNELIINYCYKIFKDYLRIKLTNTVPNCYETVVKELLEKGEISNELTTNLNNLKIDKDTEIESFTSYALKVSGPPEVLSTLVFTSKHDDLVLYQHKEKKCLKLETVQLINWPHIKVFFKNSDLSFVRYQVTDYERYLNFAIAQCELNASKVIESAEIANKDQRFCYTYRLLEAYIKEYTETLRTHSEYNEEKIEEVTTVLEQFLKDILYMNSYRPKNIATNTNIVFHLSPVPYSRNKRFLNNEKKDENVRYCEIIKPKIKLLLYEFGAKADGNMKFNIDKKTFWNSNYSLLANISYTCTFCNYEDSSKDGILHHLQNEHYMEQSAGCVKCKKWFTMTDLTKSRWQHKCARKKRLTKKS